jgi:serine/threonine protein kinase
VPKKAARPENIPHQTETSMGQPQLKAMDLVTNYSASFSTKYEAIYYEEGDGEIFKYIDMHTGLPKIMTCIDIGTLYLEKRGKALQFADMLCRVRHPSMVQILNYYVIQNRLIYIEMECPPTSQMWKSYSKQPFQTEEIFRILITACQSLQYLHQMGVVHRDVHPSRFHCFTSGIKFNPIGMPFNFKKLVKKSNFSGHINYSAPELIMEMPYFDSKVDIWALGCCIYYFINKKDLFDCNGNHKLTKNKILNCQIEEEKLKQIPQVLMPVFEACIQLNPDQRYSAGQLL